MIMERSPRAAFLRKACPTEVPARAHQLTKWLPCCSSWSSENFGQASEMAVWGCSLEKSKVASGTAP
jgi:hypothetical protein